MWNPLAGLTKSKKGNTRTDALRKAKRGEMEESQPTKAAKREPLDDISNHQKKNSLGRIEKSTKANLVHVVYLSCADYRFSNSREYWAHHSKASCSTGG